MSTVNDRLHRVVGIDLGTTYSAVAAYDKYTEQAEIVRNRDVADGSTTPSVVSVDRMSGKVIVGVAAKRNLATDPENTIIEIKREMGEVFRPETLVRLGGEGVFRARESTAGGYEGDPVKVRFCNEWFMPQEISSFTLMKMKQIAEAELGGEIRDAVVTVPAYFTAKQKEATKEAALMAGLYPRQLIPEPTAAAICYGVDRYEPTRKVYLVFDLGGGTFDVSIISVEESNIDVVATSGDPRLGGGDFDDAITRWAVDRLRESHQLDVSGDAKALALIKYHAESLKKNLSVFPEDKMVLVELRPHDPPSLVLTRETFEGLIEPLLNKSLTYVDLAIRSAEAKKGLRREEIDAILLVGGSSKIPRVKTKLLDYFQRDEDFVRSDLDADAVVARGAAIMALKFAPSPPPFDISKQPQADLINVDAAEELPVKLITEHSLGIGVQGDLMDKIVDQSTNIPVSLLKGGYTNSGPGTEIDVRVYQGEGQYVYENSLIGTLHLGPMEPKPAGFHRFEVTFALDVNGILSVTVHHLNEGKSYNDRFEQPTGIGGNDALTKRREKLVSIYAGSPAGGELQPAAASPAPVASAPTPAPLPEEAPAPSAPPEPLPEIHPSAVSPSPASTGAADALAPTVEVPEAFKSIVRRTQKLLLKNPAPALLAAFNAFVSALNAGTGENELSELADELEDVYHDCRT